MREHIQNDSNMNSILIFLGIQIETIIISLVISGLIIAYGDLNLVRAHNQRKTVHQDLQPQNGNF